MLTTTDPYASPATPMRFPESFLDEIRSRLPISDVIGTRVTWDRRKTNTARGDYWACCPFHGEKTPSFHCENRKGRYHCFGCGVTGDHFRFLTELEGISFPEAVERLAAQAGLAMPVADRRAVEREEKRASLFDVMAMAAAFFEEQLQAPTGARARAYLRERGLSPQAQKAFRLGYAPDSRNALKEHLAARGVTREQIEACGLVRHGDDIPVSYDWFRDRIMFPIPDSRDRVIAFGGRALRADVPAKYMNSPETELFRKGGVLYNFARARRAAHERGTVIAAEGYMDVIALDGAGFANAVAPLGTALTEAQLGLLWRMAAEPVLCFDGDDAGLKAAWRAIDLALPGLRPGRSVRFALLPEGRDPDDLIRQEGADAMQAVLDAALPLAEMIWRRETAAGPFATPERRAALEARLREVAAAIADESVRRHYAMDFAERLAALFGSARTGAGRGRRPPGTAGSRHRGTGGTAGLAASTSLLNSALVRRGSARMPLREAALVATVVNHPSVLGAHFDEFASLTLTSPAAAAVQRAVLDAVADWEAKGTDGDAARLGEALIAAGLAETLKAMERQLRDNRIWQALAEAAFEDALDGWRQAHALHLRTHTLNKELKAAEGALAADESEVNFQRLVQIRDEIARAEQIDALIEGFGVLSGRPARGF
ncbi:MAG: DNA primase [Alphaproteobacteria bacterium]|nr:MAG: DNA primase [Alphaproteobacteria bacterium]